MPLSLKLRLLGCELLQKPEFLDGHESPFVFGISGEKHTLSDDRGGGCDGSLKFLPCVDKTIDAVLLCGPVGMRFDYVLLEGFVFDGFRLTNFPFCGTFDHFNT